MSGKILFIDANVYLRFYDSANNKFTSLLETIVELRNNIFVTKQIRDEVYRNKLTAAINSFDANYKSLGLIKTTLPEHLDENDYKKLTAWNKKRNKIIKEENELKKEYCNIVSNTLQLIMNSTDVVSIELDKIFELAKLPSLDDLESARLRKETGNPPGKTKDPLGDQLSWEQLLRHYIIGNEIWVITNDGDYLSQYNGKYYLNPYLYNELKQRGNNKPPKIKLFDSLSKGIDDFVSKLDYSVKTMPTGNELELIMIEEAELHLHPKWQECLSSANIANIGYDPENQILVVEFQNGGVYQYLNVPREVYDNFLLSSSHGKYFQDNIKGQAFAFSKIIRPK